MPIKVTMPALSPTMTDGTLAKWLKAEGDTVEAGDVIAEIETDKATMEVEAVDEGILGKIIVAAGTQNVPVNDVIAVLLEEGESAKDIDMGVILSGGRKPAVEGSDTKPKSDPSAQALQYDKKEKTSQLSGDRIAASPLAKRIAADKGIDLSTIQGSGPRGRIVKADVEAAKSGAAAAPKALATAVPANAKTNEFGMAYTEIPNNNIKKITAKRLLESKTTVPHFYLTIECDLENLLAARKHINDQAGDAFKLSVNDFIIKAAAMALQAYPAANVSWTEDAVRQYINADISVAVATPNGLITPIVKAAQGKGLQEISEEVKALAAKARAGKLQPHEFQGGTFTISNLGMFGIKEFAAIINPPQSCILAVGAGEQRPVVVNGEVEIRTMMNCTLSTDHRTVDGAVGAEWLQIFKRYIENPVSMLV